MSTPSTACCKFQRRLLAWASMPRTLAMAACRSALAVSTAAFFCGDGDLIRLLVELGEQISSVHPVVVVHQNPRNLASDTGSNKRHMPVHICVICRDGTKCQLDPGNAESGEASKNQCAQHADQQLSPSRKPVAGRRRDDRRRTGSVLSRDVFTRRTRLDPTWLAALPPCVSVVSAGMASDALIEPHALMRYHHAGFLPAVLRRWPPESLRGLP